MRPWSNGGRLRLGDRTAFPLPASGEREQKELRSTRATPLGFPRSLRNSCYRDRFGARLDRRGAVQVRLDRGGAGAEARAVDLQILHDPLDVVARLGERDALDPVDGIDLGIARIAVLCHPLLDSAAE